MYVQAHTMHTGAATEEEQERSKQKREKRARARLWERLAGDPTVDGLALLRPKSGNFDLRRFGM
jgi:hypothetical protein